MKSKLSSIMIGLSRRIATSILLWLVEKGLVDPNKLTSTALTDLGVAIRLSHIVRSKKGYCPNNDVVSAFEHHGLYEAILDLYVDGCNIDRGILERAHLFFILSGDSKRARVTGSILGVELQRPSAAVIYCGENGMKELMVDDAIYSSRILNSASRIRLDLAGGWEDRVYSLLRPTLLIQWGCEAGGIDAKRLARIVFPDAETSIAILAHHLKEDPRYPTKVIFRLAQYFKTLVEERLDWSLIPRDLEALRDLKGGYTLGVGAKKVIVTDKPRLSIPLLKPYRLKVKVPANSRLDDAMLSAKLLEVRMGDPSRAYYYNRGVDFFGEKLAAIISSSLIEATSIDLENLGIVQVEPWDKGLISGLQAKGYIVEYDCMSYTLDCTQISGGLSRYEEKMIQDGILLPGKYIEEDNGYKRDPRGLIELHSGVVSVPGSSRYYIPDAISNITRIKGEAEPATIRIYGGSRKIKSPQEVVSVIKEYTSREQNRSVLVVTASDYISWAIASLLNGVIIEKGADLDKWLDSGGIGVASWNRVLALPEALSASYHVIFVFPESIIRGPLFSGKLQEGDMKGFIDMSLGSLLELIAKYNAFTITRAIQDDQTIRVKVEIIDYTYDSGGVQDGKVSNGSLEGMLGEVMELFKRHWGWSFDLRRHQKKSMGVLIDSYRRRIPGVVMSIYPTGAGKSAIYQLISRWASGNGFGGYGLVISPLKALMRDQVSGANRRMLKAARIDSSISMASRKLVLKAAGMGLLDLVYITPERFEDESLEELLSSSPPSLIVLDEAHTLARWGNSFRPSYLYMAKKVAELRRDMGWPPIALFTATAPGDVVGEVLSLLGVKDYVEQNVDDDMRYTKPTVIKAPVVRRELVFDVIPVPQGLERLRILDRIVKELMEWADGLGGSWIGIVFTGFVKSESEEWANANYIASYLSSQVDIPVLVYHGQMTPSSRRRIEEELYRISNSRSGGAILVATKAFGMGIDIPNIRWIIHFYPSDSVEDLYQEAGRAGRDGKEARIVIMYNPDDFVKKLKMASRQRIRPSRVLEALNTIVGVASSAKRDDKTVILPLDIISRNNVDAVRALNILRILGILDYWVVRSELKAYKTRHVDALSEYARWMWMVEKHIIISHSGMPKSPLWDESRVSIVKCSNGEVRIHAFNKDILSTGECDRPAYRYNGGKVRIAIISLNPEARVRRNKFLQLDHLQAVIRYSTIESMKLKALKELLEEALAVRVRSGPEQANNVLREGLEAYLTQRLEGALRVKQASARLAKPSVTECLTLKRCIEDIIDAISTAIEVFGEEGVAVGIKDPSIEAVVRRALASRGIRDVRIGQGIYDSILSISKNSMTKLMDMGYIIIIAKHNPNTLNALNRLRKYPYVKVYIIQS
ncbi:MAG: DEAD/DEAH box helicase [Desulfurococcales archaeon]|nr:DEAD/DEAH box helicase [Desulfurococcales archaeon]